MQLCVGIVKKHDGIVMVYVYLPQEPIAGNQVHHFL